MSIKNNGLRDKSLTLGNSGGAIIIRKNMAKKNHNKIDITPLMNIREFYKLVFAMLFIFLQFAIFSHQAFAKTYDITEIQTKILFGSGVSTKIFIDSNTPKKELQDKFDKYLEGAGLTESEFKFFHYNRNSLQKFDNISSIIDMKTGEAKPGFIKLSPEKSVFHQIGEANLENIKIVSEDGRSEYVFRRNINRVDGKETELVTNSVNAGTYNAFDPTGVHSQFLHIKWDVIPWILYGNTPADDTTYDWRTALYESAGGDTIGSFYSAVGITGLSDAADDAVNGLLLGCKCDTTSQENHILNSNTTIQADTLLLRDLIKEAVSLGGSSKLSKLKQQLIINLTQKIDPSVEKYFDSETLRRAFVQINDYAKAYNVEPIDLSKIPPVEDEPNNNENSRDEKIIWVEGLDFDEEPIVIFDPNAPPISSNDENNPSNETVFVVTKNDDGEVLIGNNAGTQIILPSRPTEPTGPTPEEIATQIADLRAERNTYSITQQDAEARLQERRNRLTVLQFNELEKVQNAGSFVRSRISELRVEQSGVGFSAADQQLLLDLVTYEDTLQTEQERIAQDITRTKAKIVEYQTALGRLETQLDDNESKLVKFNYDLSDYIVPNFSPQGLTDWSNYEYELPPFNETEPPETVARESMISAASASPTSTFLLTKGATATVTSDGSFPTTVVSDDDLLSVTATNPASGNYQYLSWGTYSGSVISYLDSNTGETHALENVRWLYGEATPSSYFLNKTGTASWTGNVYGDYALVGSNQTFYDAVTGDLGFTVDFSDNSVAGNLTTRVNYTPSGSSTISTNSNFALSGQLMTGDINGTSRAGINAQVSSFSGTEVGGINGVFFGPNAEEFGGTFHYFDSTGGASGIAVGKANNSGPDYTLPMQSTVYLMDRNYQCLGYGCSYSRILQNEIWGKWSVGTPVETKPLDGQTIRPETTIETVTGSKPSITTQSYGEYSYTAWGIWTTEETQSYGLKGQQKTKYWLAGEATHSDNLPRTGTAHYNGEMMGTLGGRKHKSAAETKLNGNIQFDANFATQAISGNYQVPGWASGTIPAMNISKNNGKAQFGGTMQHTTTSGNGTLSGTFFGSQGQEVGGVWNSGSAGGVFRAKQ